MPARTPRPRGRPGYVRAALAYADLDQKTAGEKLGVSPSTINRWMTDSPPSDETVVRIAEVCGVPIEFFERGFWGQDPADANGRRMRQLERQIIGLAERLDAVEASQRGSLTRRQAETILSELLDGATAAQAPSHEAGQGRPRAVG